MTKKNEEEEENKEEEEFFINISFSLYLLVENSEHAYIQRVLNEYKNDLANGVGVGELRPEIIKIINHFDKRIENEKGDELDFLVQVRDEYYKLINAI